MLYEHGLAIDRADERRGLVAVLEVGALLVHQPLHHLRTVTGFRVHRHKVLHAVAAVDVQHLAVGTDAVGGIDVPAVFHVIIQTPVVPIFRPEVVEVVQIGALHVQHLPEKTLLGHVQHGDLEKVVDAVLQHHAVLAGAFAGVDEQPYLVQRHGGGHLDSHVLAVFHGIDGQRHMVHPVGGDVDKVDVVAVAHRLVGLGAATVARRTRTAEFLQQLLALLHTFGLHIAQSLDIRALDLREALHRIGTAHAQSDEAHAHRLHRRGGQLQHVLLPRRPFRDFRLDHFRRLSAQAERHQQPSHYEKGNESFHTQHFCIKLWWQRYIIIHLYWIAIPNTLIYLHFSVCDSR